MHERAYRLLRLYPAQFRRTHGDEALQLFHDRLRDELGFVNRFRLWLDLLADFSAIRMRGYHELSLTPAVASSGYGIDRVPSFGSLEQERLQTRSLLWGGILSALLCTSAITALEHGRGHLPPESVSAYATPAVSKSRVHVEFTSQLLHPSKTPTVRLKAVVTPINGGPMPTGTITFDYGWATVATGTLIDGTVVLDAKLPDNKEHAMDALYLGDLNYSIARSMASKPTANTAH
jgi:hypothetical protein